MNAIKKALTGHSSHSGHSHHEGRTGDAVVAAERTTSAAVVPEGVATERVAATKVAAVPAPAATATAVAVPAGLEAQAVEREAAVVETVVKPAVVHETTQLAEQENIKAVVEREREQTEIRQVVQPVLDRQVNDTTYSEAVDDVEERVFKEDISAEDRALYERNAAFQNESRDLGVERTAVVQPTEVHERLKTKVVEEIIPVVEREVVNTHVINRVKPIHEKVIHAPKITSSVRAPITAAEAGLLGNRLDNTQLASVATTTASLTQGGHVNLVQEKSVGLPGAAPAGRILREE